MRALYINRDDPARGLEHGKHYHIKQENFKNGKIRVTVEETREKLTYADPFAFARDWMVKGKESD